VQLGEAPSAARRRPDDFGRPGRVLPRDAICKPCPAPSPAGMSSPFHPGIAIKISCRPGPALSSMPACSVFRNLTAPQIGNLREVIAGSPAGAYQSRPQFTMGTASSRVPGVESVSFNREGQESSLWSADNRRNMLADRQVMPLAIYRPAPRP